MDGASFTAMLTSARAGEDWALAALWRWLHPAVLAYLRAQLPGEAEDLASDVFVAVAHGLDRFEGEEGRFRSWVFAIAHHRLVDARRRLARRRTDPAPPDVIAAAGARGDAEVEALAALGTGSALARVAALPPAQAEVVLLRVVADLPVAEVAAIVGRRPEAVRALQHRALRRLAREISREAVTT